MSHAPPPAGVCAHWRYRLSCDDFDLLAADFDNRCAICKRQGHETGHGCLFIDHNPFVGQWAVRGLLCNTCNVRISVDCGATAADAAYLANPWCLRWLTDRGLDPTIQPEPPVGGYVYMYGRRPKPRAWRRTRRGWECATRDARSTLTWEQLNRHYGPHNLYFERPPRREMAS